MTVVDSSVWIAFLRRQDRPAVRFLHSIARPSNLIVGDVVLLEVLRGARDSRHAGAIERELRRFQLASMLDAATAVQAARHYRTARQAGVTVSKLADLLIATYCIANDRPLLHLDRDFDRLVEPLGLRVVPTSGS